MTIHKTQGLTLDRVEVDGDNIFSAGQLGVAIGRTTKKKNLRLLNFHPKSVLKHDYSLYEFNEKCVSEEFSENLNCCSLDIPDTIDQLCQEGIGYEEHDEDELPDFSREEIEGIEKLFSADDFPRELLSEDIFQNVLKNEITEIFRKVHPSEEIKV